MLNFINHDVNIKFSSLKKKITEEASALDSQKEARAYFLDYLEKRVQNDVKIELEKLYRIHWYRINPFKRKSLREKIRNLEVLFLAESKLHDYVSNLTTGECNDIWTNSLKRILLPVVQSTTVGTMTSSFVVGQNIKAKVNGGSRYYPGIITKVNKNNTYNIDFIDGDYKNHVESVQIRP